MWGFANNLSSLTQLIDNPETTIEKVLDDPALNAGIRNGLSSLMEFLIRPENMNRMLEIALEAYAPDTQIPQKTTRMAVSVLSTGTSTLMNMMIKKSMEFMERVKNFPSSSFKTNPKCCGHFFRIVESLVRFTAGQFLQEMPQLRDFLVKEMCCIGLRELFCVLCSDYSQNFDVNPQMFIDLTKNANNKETGWYMLTSLREILKVKEVLVDDMRTKETIENLLTIGKNDELGPLIQIEAFSLISRIIDVSCNDIEERDMIEDLVKKASTTYDFTKERPINVVAAALNLFRTNDPAILMKILTNDVMTSYKDGIIKSFNAMNKGELESFIAANNLLAKIIESFNANKGNYHISLLSKIIQERFIEGDDAWKEFVNGPLKQKNEMRNQSYGHELPNSDYSESYEENNDIAFMSDSSDYTDSDSYDSSSEEDDDDDDADYADLENRIQEILSKNTHKNIELTITETNSVTQNDIDDDPEKMLYSDEEEDCNIHEQDQAPLAEEKIEENEGAASDETSPESTGEIPETIEARAKDEENEDGSGSFVISDDESDNKKDKIENHEEVAAPQEDKEEVNKVENNDNADQQNFVLSEEEEKKEDVAVKQEGNDNIKNEEEQFVIGSDDDSDNSDKPDF